MKQIVLTQGQYALVDDADYDWLNQYKWCAVNMKGNFYAVRMSPRRNGKQNKILMHRQILGLEEGDKRQGDHINHNTLDNRRDNIRICTQQENHMNRKSRPNTSSRFKGVSWCSRTKKWMAQIRINRKQIFLGRFRFEELAALSYDFAALKYFREFANFNF